MYLAAEKLITKLSEYGESGIRLHLHLVSLLLVSSCSSPTRYDTSIPPAIKPEKCTMGGREKRTMMLELRVGRQRGRARNAVGG